MKNTHAVVLLVIANVIWGASHAMGKIAVETFDPFLLAALRVCIASVAFWILRLTGVAPAEAMPRRDVGILASLGLLTVAGAQFLDYQGLSFTTATDSSLMIIGEVIFTTLLAWFVAREHISRRRGIGMLLGIVGVVVLTIGGAPDSTAAPHRALGNTLVLAALFCESLFTVVGARFSQRYDASTILRWTYTGSLFVWVPILIWSIVSGRFPTATAAAWLAVGYMAIATSVVSYTIWFWVIRHAGSGLGAMTLFVQPLVGSFVGMVILNEPRSTGLIIGGALILSAMFVATTGHDEPALTH